MLRSRQNIKGCHETLGYLSNFVPQGMGQLSKSPGWLIGAYKQEGCSYLWQIPTFLTSSLQHRLLWFEQHTLKASYDEERLNGEWRGDTLRSLPRSKLREL